MFKIRVERLLDKNIEQVFEAITDHENYKKFPGVSDSKLLEEGKNHKNGEGALREIIAGPFKFIERITCYEKPQKMNYLIQNTSPIPMKHEKGEVTMESVEGKTLVLWVSEGHMKVPLVGGLIDKAVEYKISRAFRAMLDYIDGN